MALGEGRHGNEQGQAFRLSLIRDPRFSALANDIVVEFGSSRYQAVMDRFIQGDQVRRALIIYGDMHFVRHHAVYNYERSSTLDGNSIVTLLERHRPPTKVFTIWTNTTADLETLQPDVAGWAKPSLAKLRDTALGEADFTFYNPEVARYPIRDGKPDLAKPLARDRWRSLAMQEQPGDEGGALRSRRLGAKRFRAFEVLLRGSAQEMTRTYRLER